MSNPDKMVDLTTIANKDNVVVGRSEDDMIMVVMPPSVLGVTFMLLASNHMEVSCGFVNSLAYHMENEDVVAQRIAPPEVVKLIRDNMIKRHGGAQIVEGFLKRGDSSMFEGLYYGEFTPLELAGVGQVMKEIKGLNLDSSEAPTVTAIIDMWVNAADQFVRDTERLALWGTEGKA